MKFTETFQNISAKDVWSAGGKGASLGEMTQLELPVPQGFILLSNAFEEFISRTKLNEQISLLLDKVHLEKVDTIKETSSKIQKYILAQDMPKEMIQEIVDQYKKLNEKYVAVRSSATSEDNADAAWAGQLDSFLNVTEDTLVQHIKKCWASLFNPRAIFYRFDRGLEKSHISIAVIIQKMIDPEVAGIAFSVHPVTEDSNHIVIEAGFGLGEAIVSGKITPSHFVVEKNTMHVVEKYLMQQSRGLFRSSKSGIEWRKLPNSKRAVLTDVEIEELSQIILRIEKHYGFPCDIEWVRENGRFQIVQSRPITTLGHLNNNNKSNYQKVEWYYVINRPRCPLINSIMMRGITTRFEYQMPLQYEQHNIGIIGGVWYGDKKHDDFLRQELLKMLDTKPDILMKLIISQKRHWTAFEENISSFNQINFTILTDQEILQYFDEIINFLLKWNSINLWLLWLPEKPIENIINRIVENKVTTGIIEKSESQDYFLACTKSSRQGYFELEQKNLRRICKIIKKEKLLLDSKRVTTLIGEHCKSFSWLANQDFRSIFWEEADIRQRVINQLNSGMTCEQKRGKNIDIQKLALSKDEYALVQLAQELVYYRTFRTDIQWKTGYLARMLFSEIANRLQLSFDDFHNCFYWEIIDALRGQKMVDKDLIQLRNVDYAYLFVEGEELCVHDQNELVSLKSYFDCLQETTVFKNILQGDIANKGKARGYVKIVKDTSELELVTNKDILFATMTKPTFIPAMDRALAFVTDEGGILCHAAIISREMKKPCIIGTKIATQIFKNGDYVEVDADNGFVKLI